MASTKVLLFCENFTGNPYLELLTTGLKHLNIDVEVQQYRLWFLFQVLIQSKANVVHLQTLHQFFVAKSRWRHALKFAAFVLQLGLIRLLGIKVVWTVHELRDRFHDGKYRDLSPRQAALFGKVCSGIIVHCPTTKAEVIDYCAIQNEQKVFVIPHGNYINSYRNELDQIQARQLLDIPATAIVFLLFGNIHRTKGFLEAIDAFQQLRDPFQNKSLGDCPYLLIVGNPAEADLGAKIQALVQRCDTIRFVPQRVEDDDIQIYMNACDCVVFPYTVFTTSGVVLLAISFGKTCIAPRMGYFGDVLDQSGTFFNETATPAGLLLAMQTAISQQSNLAAMGEHNFNLATQWNWDFVAQETFKVYQTQSFAAVPSVAVSHSIPQ
jgi:beta-1,4-mannosyltransferase